MKKFIPVLFAAAMVPGVHAQDSTKTLTKTDKQILRTEKRQDRKATKPDRQDREREKQDRKDIRQMDKKKPASVGQPNSKPAVLSTAPAVGPGRN